MSRTEQDVWKEMEEMVDSGNTYRFESADDSFEPFEGKPVKLDNEMCVEITKGNNVFDVGGFLYIDVGEFCFMIIKKVD